MENMTVPLVAVVGINLLNLGYQIGHLVGNNSADADGRVERVQAYNEELTHQLNDGNKLVAHLVVNDSDKSFRFDTVDSAKQSEECTGNFVLRNSVATATGKLACTIMTPIR